MLETLLRFMWRHLLPLEMLLFNVFVLSCPFCWHFFQLSSPLYSMADALICSFNQCPYFRALLWLVHVLPNGLRCAVVQLQEPVETPCGHERIRRNLKTSSLTKAQPKAPKPAGLSRPTKMSTPPSNTSKPDASKQAAPMKPKLPVEKVEKFHFHIFHWSYMYLCFTSWTWHSHAGGAWLQVGASTRAEAAKKKWRH